MIETSTNYVVVKDLTEYAKNRGSDSNELFVTMCGSSGRCGKAATIRTSECVKNVRILEGGLKARRDADLPVA